MKSTEPVRVAVNIRPLLTSEGCTDCITVTPDEPQVHIGSHTFTYDLVFGNNGLPFSEIYHRCVAPLVEDLFKGYNATILAYGQTASGKSYTMGTNCGADGGGIIPKVMEDVFTRVEAVKSQIRISFLEIYNEEIYDLLAASKPSRAPIRIRETNSGEITLQGVTEVQVKTKEEMSSYLARGSSTRATGITNMNIQSSRSHAIFTISVKITTAEETLCAKIRLVDLAGSERANRTGADGIRLKEGRHINSSLLALGNVIKILGGNERNKKKGVCHIPYRVSKLTRLLQDSLGGNSKTVMIACVSPAITDVEETLSTLRYANYARNIKNKAVVQKQKPSTPCFDAMVKELTPSNSDAKNKTVVQKHTPSSDYDAMVKELTPSPSKSESLPVYDKMCMIRRMCSKLFLSLRSHGLPKQLGLMIFLPPPHHLQS
ncbi:kinesin-like protein KIN-4C [Raphanus sativus]|uniref:Kinesin-like protein n=1 Tax=Raphanus sativus TaxID=3726 RepID=A0A9W3CB66_RAPSA|nr:kinesin-like protein KIN-4C [Raphanus sativus]